MDEVSPQLKTMAVKEKKKYTPFCDHFKRGRCKECQAIRERIKNEPRDTFKKHKALFVWHKKVDLWEEAWQEARGVWLEELGLSEANVEKDEYGIQFVKASGFYAEEIIIHLPYELTSKYAFKRRLEERDY